MFFCHCYITAGLRSVIFSFEYGKRPLNDHQIVDAVIVIYNLCVGTMCRQIFCHTFKMYHMI